MNFRPNFPTILHRDTAELVRDYFLTIPIVDTVLVVNSCARGQAVPESDLDFAILVNPNSSKKEIQKIETAWQIYSGSQQIISKYKQSTPFAHLHLDVINGNYKPAKIEKGEPIDYFEIEIGNQICYSAPMDNAGSYFIELQTKWLPYYNENLHVERLSMIQNACEYDIDHIPFFMRRGLHFQAFDILCKAFQEYLQTLFIANRTYPIAYNKWIKEQVTKWLNKPDLYPQLPAIISVCNIESNEINTKAETLHQLLKNVTNESNDNNANS
jgi:hypothetical protein